MYLFKDVIIDSDTKVLTRPPRASMSSQNTESDSWSLVVSRALAEQVTTPFNKSVIIDSDAKVAGRLSSGVLSIKRERATESHIRASHS